MEKKLVQTACLELVAHRIKMHQDSLELLKDSADDDTKSSAGDKFETSREMLRQEEEKIELQLAQLQQQRLELAALKTEGKHEHVQKGSMVKTDQGMFYLSTALGKVKYKEESFFAISLSSPMAIALLTKDIGDQVEVNNRSIKIMDIY